MTTSSQPERYPLRAEQTRSLEDPPGGLLMWIVVALELVAFTIIFVLVALLRASDPEVFRAGQASLDVGMGLTLTLTLVTSGWLIAEAVHAARARALVQARRFYLAGIGAGLGFVVLKVSDLAAKVQAGHGLGVDDFWDAYLLSTAFHFAHVLVGLGMLVLVALRLGKREFEDAETAIAGTALFWHMCDVAWFFLFPLFFAGAR